MFVFKKKNTFPTEVRVTEGSNFLNSLKNIVIIFAVIFVGLKFLPNIGGSSITSKDGVVFKNISNEYDSILSSYDSVLINKESVLINDSTKKNKEPHKGHLNLVTVKKTDLIKEDNLKDVNKKHHNVFVIDYIGTLQAKEVSYLTKKIDAIVLKANPEDEVIMNITSGGGVVSGYGLVASQINRLKVAGLKITTTVDTVAASGGYMAAVVSDEIVAAPFAMVGSIGVVANVMIYEEFLKNSGVQTNVYTSGDSKRTVVPSRVPTKEEEAKLENQLEKIHQSFKDHILAYRPDVSVDKVFTGEAFLAVEAMKYGLVDKIGTSSDVILSLYKEGHRIIKVQYETNESLGSSLSKQISSGLVDVIKTEVFDNITIL